MGWMHDTLDYMSRDPIYRRWHHDKMTFGLLYAFSENFVLPISHDEVVHGKGSVVGKMPGDEWQRFANARAYLRLHVGPSRQEAAVHGPGVRPDQRMERLEALPWWLLDHWPHQGVQALVRDLNRLYRETPGAPRARLRARGISAGSSSTTTTSRCSPSCARRGGDPPVAVVCNFTPEPRAIIGSASRAGLLAGGAQHRRRLPMAAPNIGNFGGVTAEARPSHGFRPRRR
jgi:1,4-alpha-glucan branching enzyme